MAERDLTRLRATDTDRQTVVDRLKEALDEGRITLGEYDERVGSAYRALTYADLNVLLEDLPMQGGVLEIRPMTAAAATRATRAGRPAKRRRVPMPIMILWTVWGGVVALNIAVWVTVMVMTGHHVYPWPVWVAVPLGAPLLAATIGVELIRRRPDWDDPDA